VRQASGVIVEVGAGEGVGVGGGVCEAVGGTGVEVGRGWFDGAQAEIAVRSVSNSAIRFIA